MPIYSIAQAKDRLSQLVDEALAGEEVTITRHGKAVAELRPAKPRRSGRPSAQLLAEITARAKRLPSFGRGADESVREMRDERA